MTLTQKLTIERAEIQNKLNSDKYIEIRGNDADADARLVEAKALRDQLNHVNVKLIEAIKADGGADTTPETREWSGLSSRFDLASFSRTSWSTAPPPALSLRSSPSAAWVETTYPLRC